MNIANLDTIDQVLICAFVIFIAFVVTALLVVTRDGIREWAMRMLASAVVRIEAFNEWLEDDEKYDPSWMDFDAWKRTRVERRAR